MWLELVCFWLKVGGRYNESEGLLRSEKNWQLGDPNRVNYTKLVRFGSLVTLRE